MIEGEIRMQSGRFEKGHTPWNRGKSHSEETIEKIRHANLKNPNRYWLGKKRPPTPLAVRIKISESLKKVKNKSPIDKNYRKNNHCTCGKLITNHARLCYKCSGNHLSKIQKGKKRKSPSEVVRKKIADAERFTKTGLTEPPKFNCVVCSEEVECKPYESHDRKYCSKKCMYKNVGNAISKAQKKNWLNPKFAQKMGEALSIKPNKPEAFLQRLLDRCFPNEWKYTGDFKFWIENKCPDFINCNGKKLIIEFDGKQWHKDSHEDKKRNEIYARYGYKTLSLNEDDLESWGWDFSVVLDDVKTRLYQKILKFME